MKKIIILLLITIGFSSCKNKSDEKIVDENNVVTEKDSVSNLALGCYTYSANNNNISLEITNLENGVSGKLNYSLSEKDRNSGTFTGKIDGENLIGTYQFMSEGIESKREVAFKIKDNQLIEGYGDMNENGTAFVDKSKINYSSTMPLTKTDCAVANSDCLFVNGKAYSNLSQKCLLVADLKTKLNPLKDGAMTSGKPAYIIFDDSNTKAELFLPDANEGLVLEKESEGNWKNGDYYLIAWKGYVVQYKGKAVFGGQ